MKTNIMKSLALILSVSLLVLPACSGGGRSKSVEDAGSYDELTADFDDDDEDVEDEDEEDPADDDTSDQEGDSRGREKDSYEERYRKWKEHEEWRDKDVDNYKTAREYADHYHDDYIELYMEQYYGDEDYDEGTMLEQSYLDAIHHWEKNRPWPKPEKYRME